MHLKLRAGEVIALNQVYENANVLPKGMKVLDCDGDQVTEASLRDMTEGFSIEYENVRFYLKNEPPSPGRPGARPVVAQGNGESVPTPQLANLPGRITAAISSSLDECFSKDKAGNAFSSAPIELPQFQPKPEALLRPLLKGDITLRSVPRNPSELFLLFHDLHNEEAPKTPAFEYIEECGSNGPAALYGTSGVGKTRVVFEYLSRNKGIYLVSQPSPRDPGSEDLVSVFSGLKHLREESKTERNKAISQDNLKVVVQRLQVLLYVRKAVHDRIQFNIEKRSFSL